VKIVKNQSARFDARISLALRIMYIMLNNGFLAGVRCLSRLIQIGSVPIILRPAIPFDSGTYKLIVRSRQSWCHFTEIATRIVEFDLTSGYGQCQKF
jgi:hypothetical protein